MWKNFKVSRAGGEHNLTEWATRLSDKRRESGSRVRANGANCPPAGLSHNHTIWMGDHREPIFYADSVLHKFILIYTGIPNFIPIYTGLPIFTHQFTQIYIGIHKFICTIEHFFHMDTHIYTNLHKILLKYNGFKKWETKKSIWES